MLLHINRFYKKKRKKLQRGFSNRYTYLDSMKLFEKQGDVAAKIILNLITRNEFFKWHLVVKQFVNINLQ